MKQSKITLVAKNLAKEGFEFVYNGRIGICDGCRMNKVCNNLDTGIRYRVLAKKTDAFHTCRIHNEGVSAVEVCEAPIPATIDSKRAIKNSEVIYSVNCAETGCQNYQLCFPEGLTDGEKYQIASIPDSEISCPKGRNLKVVTLIRF